MAPKFHTRFNHAESIGIEFDEPSLTEQSFAFESDINNIINGYGGAPIPKTPLFDITFDSNQFENALNVVAEAKSKFEEMPSFIRDRFENNPSKLIEFVQDDKNYDEALKLGLVNPRADIPTPTIPPVLKPSTTVTVAPVSSTVSPVSSD